MYDEHLSFTKRRNRSGLGGGTLPLLWACASKTGFIPGPIRVASVGKHAPLFDFPCVFTLHKKLFYQISMLKILEFLKIVFRNIL